MIIPPQQLEQHVLDNLLDSFITRDGTDYGEQELPLEEKRQRLLKQVHSGKVVISYDEKTDSVNLVSQDDLNAIQGEE